ncbi:MAG: AAA family ATPase, partial [Methylococcales bacterium]
KHTRQMMFDLQVGINGYHVEFSPNLDDDSLVFSQEYCTINSSFNFWKLYPKKGESGFVSGEQADSEGVKSYTQEYLEKCRVYHFDDTSSQARFKKTKKLVSDYYLEEDAANIAPFLYRLKTSKTESDRRSYQQIVSAIKTVAPFFHDFYLEPTGEEGDKNILFRWTHTQRDAPFSANVLSDGTARFIFLATLFLQPKDRRPDTIILDEPELGLHPAALDVLAEIIHATAKETQVICSTQSVAFANLFAPEDFIVVDAKEGVSHFRRLETEPLKHWLEDYGMGDLWTKNLFGGRPAW